METKTVTALLEAAKELIRECNGESKPRWRHEMINTQGFCMLRGAIANAEGE